MSLGFLRFRLLCFTLWVVSSATHILECPPTRPLFSRYLEKSPEPGFCPKGYCVRDIVWSKKDVWIVSGLCLCVGVAFWLKCVIFDFLHAYFRCKIHETGSSWLKFKNLNCAQSGFFKIGTFRFLNFRQSVELFTHTIALRVTLPCRCNLVVFFTPVFLVSETNGVKTQGHGLIMEFRWARLFGELIFKWNLIVHNVQTFPENYIRESSGSDTRRSTLLYPAATRSRAKQVLAARLQIYRDLPGIYRGFWASSGRQ